MAIIKTISDLLWGMPLIVLILLAGIIFTVGSKFFQIAHLKHILKNTIGTLFSKKDNGKGMMKPLEVISIAVGGAVGVGNIGGVATAIAVGGPGAAFWIWVAAFLGMMMKMAEVSLAVYYRSKDEKGGYYGGPTYYMEKGLGRDKGFKFWGVLAVIFGIGIFGNVFSMQNFTVAQSVNATFGIPMLAVGLVYVGLTYLATVREIPWLGKLAAKVVPPMCVFYLVGGIVIIIVNITIARSTWTDYQRCIYRDRSHRRFHGSGRGFDYPNRLIPRHVLQRGWLGYIAYDSRLRQNGASGEAGIVGGI